ncbi:MAG TPA: monovalent cation/H(+) antiporter subunit G [Pirellulales bacterium]
MTHHPLVTGMLLGLAVAIALLSAAGMAVIRNTYQRLHFSALVVSLSGGLIAVAVWIEQADAQARIKVILTVGLLFVMNSILTHATARAVRIRRTGSWDPQPDEHIEPLGQQPAAQRHSAGRRARRRRRGK